MRVAQGWRRHQQLVVLALVALVVALGCLALGRWQWERYDAKHQRRQVVAANYDAPVAALADVLPPGARSLDPARQWRPVRVVGRYDPRGTVLVRNRARDASGSGPRYGYEVLVPLLLDDGSTLVVDRGWIASGTRGDRPGERPDAVPPGQVASIALDRLAAGLRAQGLRGPVLPAYGVLAAERPAPATAPALLPMPPQDGGEGINASYAVQWVVFAALALGFPFWFVRRQRALASGQVTPPVRRRRIWDEEDE